VRGLAVALADPDLELVRVRGGYDDTGRDLAAFRRALPAGRRNSQTPGAGGAAPARSCYGSPTPSRSLTKRQGWSASFVGRPSSRLSLTAGP
jgi:hypothetical protein